MVYLHQSGLAYVIVGPPVRQKTLSFENTRPNRYSQSDETVL